MKVPIKLDFASTPRVIQALTPFLTWRRSDDAVTFTFDDGPWPELTLKLIDVLDRYEAKATFFCLGERVEQFPAEFEALVEAGHSIGCHSYSHLDGWRTNPSEYLADIERGCEVVAEALGRETRLFRPPYGHVSPFVVPQLRRRGLEIIMWDTLSFDYDDITPEAVAANVVDNVKPGSIVLLHDGPVAEPRVVQAVDQAAAELSARGMTLAAL